MNLSERGSEKMRNTQVDVSGVDEAKPIRKIDWRLLSWPLFIPVNFFDHVSIADAKVRQLARLLRVSVWALYGTRKRCARLSLFPATG